MPNASILIVDDSPANLLAYEGLLGRLGQPLVKAASGDEALQLASQREFAVAIMDVMMPGLDGFDTTARLRQRERGQRLPVIFITAGSEDPKWTARAYQLGAIDMMYKPVHPDQLLGKVSALVGIFERNQAEAAIAFEQAARATAEAANRQKDEFLWTLSHELRTPLTAIIGWTELLKSDRVSGDQAREALETILRAARTQERLVDDLLDASRIMAGKFAVGNELVDWSDGVQTTALGLAPMAASRDIDLRVSVAERILVQGDPLRLAQVTFNLLSNGLKFARPQGGVVELTLRADGATAELAVSDNGVGIAPEFLPHVFDRFRQADSSRARVHPGLGLGLTIVHYIVSVHGGTVTAHSGGLNQGARFVVRLPLATAAGKEPRKSNKHAIIPVFPDGGSPWAGLSILFVEDDDDARELITVILEEEGARVTPARTAEAALQALGVGGYDLILSDIGLPDQDGLAFMRQVRALTSIPAIALTGFAGGDEETQALAAGFSGYLSKPLHIDQLTTLLCELGVQRRSAAKP